MTRLRHIASLKRVRKALEKSIELQKSIIKKSRETTPNTDKEVKTPSIEHSPLFSNPLTYLKSKAILRIDLESDSEQKDYKEEDIITDLNNTSFEDYINQKSRQKQAKTAGNSPKKNLRNKQVLRPWGKLKQNMLNLNSLGGSPEPGSNPRKAFSSKKHEFRQEYSAGFIRKNQPWQWGPGARLSTQKRWNGSKKAQESTNPDSGKGIDPYENGLFLRKNQQKVPSTGTGKRIDPKKRWNYLSNTKKQLNHSSENSDQQRELSSLYLNNTLQTTRKAPPEKSDPDPKLLKSNKSQKIEKPISAQKKTKNGLSQTQQYQSRLLRNFFNSNKKVLGNKFSAKKFGEVRSYITDYIKCKMLNGCLEMENFLRATNSRKVKEKNLKKKFRRIGDSQDDLEPFFGERKTNGARMLKNHRFFGRQKTAKKLKNKNFLLRFSKPVKSARSGFESQKARKRVRAGRAEMIERQFSEKLFKKFFEGSTGLEPNPVTQSPLMANKRVIRRPKTMHKVFQSMKQSAISKKGSQKKKVRFEENSLPCYAVKASAAKKAVYYSPRRVNQAKNDFVKIENFGQFEAALEQVQSRRERYAKIVVVTRSSDGLIDQKMSVASKLKFKEKKLISKQRNHILRRKKKYTRLGRAELVKYELEQLNQNRKLRKSDVAKSSQKNG